VSSLEQIFQLISTYGFPIVIAVILLVFFIKSYSAFNETLKKQTEILNIMSSRLDTLEEVILNGKKE
jgi:hypothetical protein